MARDVDTVLTAVGRGLTWHRFEGPIPDSTGVKATGPTFNVVCASWEMTGLRHYTAIVTMLEPHMSIINLPPQLAQVVYAKAISSFN